MLLVRPSHVKVHEDMLSVYAAALHGLVLSGHDDELDAEHN